MNIKFILIVAAIAIFAFISTKSEVNNSSTSETAEPAAGTLWTEPKTGMQLVWVPGGCFDMGSSLEKNEQPIHQVCVKGFYLGKHEVTQAQYHQITGHTPGYSNVKPDDKPASNIAWVATNLFFKDLNSSGGPKLRLPSESEWEYACRAGGKHKTYCGDGQLKKLGWHKSNSNKQPHSVGNLRPNDFGLYDMSGNVWEWVEDVYHDNYQGAPADGSPWAQQGFNTRRVLRGGSYDNNAEDALASFRTSMKALAPHQTFGFRVAMTPQ